MAATDPRNHCAASRRLIASEVADIGAEFLAAEEIVMRYVKGPGQKSLARYNELRQEFQSIVAALTKRVSRKKP